jgi:hypothetical protein
LKRSALAQAKDDACVNDDSVGDSYGDTCTDYYDANPTECGNYDSADFVASDLCCACTGMGQMSGDYSYTYTSDPTEYSYTYTSDPITYSYSYSTAGDSYYYTYSDGLVGGDSMSYGMGADACVNDDTVGDSYGDTCTDYYDANPTECGNYDSADFVASDLCCACTGMGQMSGDYSYTYTSDPTTYSYTYTSDPTEWSYTYTYTSDPTTYSYSYSTAGDSYYYTYSDGLVGGDSMSYGMDNGMMVGGYYYSDDGYEYSNGDSSSDYYYYTYDGGDYSYSYGDSTDYYYTYSDGSDDYYYTYVGGDSSTYGTGGDYYYSDDG